MMGTMGNSDGSDAPAVLAVLKTYKTSHLVKVILRLRGCAARSSEFLERGDVEHALIATLRGDDVTSPEGVQAAIAACGVHRTTGEDTMGAKSTVYQGSSSAAAATNPSDASGGEATEAALPPASTEASSATAATSSGAVPDGAAGDDGATNDAANATAAATGGSSVGGLAFLANKSPRPAYVLLTADVGNAARIILNSFGWDSVQLQPAFVPHGFEAATALRMSADDMRDCDRVKLFTAMWGRLRAHCRSASITCASKRAGVMELARSGHGANAHREN